MYLTVKVGTTQSESSPQPTASLPVSVLSNTPSIKSLYIRVLFDILFIVQLVTISPLVPNSNLHFILTTCSEWTVPR